MTLTAEDFTSSDWVFVLNAIREGVASHPAVQFLSRSRVDEQACKACDELRRKFFGRDSNVRRLATWSKDDVRDFMAWDGARRAIRNLDRIWARHDRDRTFEADLEAGVRPGPTSGRLPRRDWNKKCREYDDLPDGVIPPNPVELMQLLTGHELSIVMMQTERPPPSYSKCLRFMESDGYVHSGRDGNDATERTKVKTLERLHKRALAKAEHKYRTEVVAQLEKHDVMQVLLGRPEDDERTETRDNACI